MQVCTLLAIPHLLVLDHQRRAAASGKDLLGGAGVEVRMAGVDRVAAGRQDGGRVDGQLQKVRTSFIHLT